MTKVIGIVGPTAVGKTALSIQLAQRLNGEIISGDSMQVYRNLNIGTAKIMPDEMQGVKHHLINIRDISERFSVADFQSLANHEIDAIQKRNELPIIVGGTGFYVQALTENLSLGADHYDEKSDQIRQKWHQIAVEKGNQYVWDSLNKLDHKAAQKIPVQNVRRAIRALEVIEKTGHLFSEQPDQQALNDFYLIGLNTDRKVLYQRINQRVDQMVQMGLVKEARWLYEHGGLNFQSGKGIGYRELFPYFEGQTDLQSAIDKIKLDSRHYAKRQLTWFRNKMEVHWYDLVSGQDSIDDIELAVKEWLNK